MTRRSRNVLVSATSLLFAALAGHGCAQAFQDARLVGPGRVEITPNVSAAGVADEGESEHITNNFGVHAIVGIHERLDVGFGYMRAQIVDEDDGANVIGFGPKVGLVRDRVAFGVPMAIAVGEEDVAETFTILPTVFFTAPISSRVDFNPAARLVIPTCEDCEMLVGFNVGVGIKTADQRVNIRPEVAFQFNPGESGVVWTFGVGVSLRPK